MIEPRDDIIGCAAIFANRTLTISVLADIAEQQQQKVVEPGMWVGVFCLKKEFCQVPNKMVSSDTIPRDVGPDFPPVSLNCVRVGAGVWVDNVY
ncbi:hypothetical protein J6590_057653 [Homalodisca vitripennis]|nr:hypothetical protein J6590_057653 [Homalodisca vitripennis]